MAEFAYNNIKNVNIGYTFFELNCNYHFHVSYKENIDSYFKLKSAGKLSMEHQKLITIYKKNLYQVYIL